ncbi:hypothetical protein KEM56_003289 [Ascosphaera pollenicola]|nr:hypothetical protein KEM56_003289 [Ascosphaera pollenicola]
MDQFIIAETGYQPAVKKVRDYRESTLAKVEPPLKDLPSPLPANCQGLPAQVLTERERELTEKYEAVELVELMSSKKVTCEEVTRAFLRRAALAQAATNCLTELIWDEAIERARQLDSLSTPAGPLHGLPISLKESNGLIIPGVKNFTNSTFFLAWADLPSAPSGVNSALWNAGAVFFARTTGPQTLMQLESNSSMYGRTLNPYNTALTCGGSSGGEGALIAFRGSVLGIGSDIGGSIRNPAVHCGIYGFKPTTGRWPLNGGRVPPECYDIEGTYGPMTTSREALSLLMKVLADSEPWKVTPSLIPKLWTPYHFDKPLKVAVLWDDGVVKPHPPITRALKEVAESCKNAGMEVVDWTPIEHDRAWDLTSALYFTDGGESNIKTIIEGDEPVLPLTDWITRGQPNCRQRSNQEVWALKEQRAEYQAKYAAHWNATAKDGGREVDVILCPAAPGVAPQHETSKYWPYTSQWNLLDYPAVVFPVTTINPAKDLPDTEYKPRNKQDAYAQSLYTDPEVFRDAPVGLQVVGRRHFDEKVLAALELIEKAMGRK